ncbi:N-acetyltransferase [Dactylosporangium vinaceum]|uniref:N-acetyltransferase n=1 Tax=Dactylosporangium vinaceum TaxID=53362 RepID=A0ABV5MFQ7_9ACTN|nr:N-acetyltransferase [Dactylosporangium vinaceum]UAB98836.1 N-acetyltransferase [Dactylosporangium vinaceum]
MDFAWLEVTTLAERPDRTALTSAFDDPTVAPFLYHDPISAALFPALVARHPQYTLMAVEKENGRAAGMLCTLPFTAAEGLPPGGYDAVLLSAAGAPERGPDVSALFATVRPDLRGRGVSGHLLDLARHNAAALGHTALVAPVRPTHKHEHPGVPLEQYVARRRPDGTAQDPWLRVHERAGGRFVAVAPHSMTITATLERWREWTGLPFDTAGPVVVPGGLNPVLCDPERDIATYVEANAWYRHDLQAGRQS